MPSNSLLKDFQANSSQLNRLVTNKLNVNSLRLNDVNDSNVSPDDILLVLITLTLQSANLYSDRIEFKVDDLQLTEWEQRTVGKAKVDYNKHYNYKNDAALDVLRNLWNDDYQGKYSASLHSPNANLTILVPEESFTNRYIIIKDYAVNENIITLFIESQEESPEIKSMKNVPLKIVIDQFKEYDPIYLDAEREEREAERLRRCEASRSDSRSNLNQLTKDQISFGFRRIPIYGLFDKNCNIIN